VRYESVMNGVAAHRVLVLFAQTRTTIILGLITSYDTSEYTIRTRKEMTPCWKTDRVPVSA
jgi:hypothetical protein